MEIVVIAFLILFVVAAPFIVAGFICYWLMKGVSRGDFDDVPPVQQVQGGVSARSGTVHDVTIIDSD